MKTALTGQTITPDIAAKLHLKLLNTRLYTSATLEIKAQEPVKATLQYYKENGAGIESRHGKFVEVEEVYNYDATTHEPYLVRITEHPRKKKMQTMKTWLLCKYLQFSSFLYHLRTWLENKIS